MRILQVVPNFGGGGVHAVAKAIHSHLHTDHEMHLLSLTPYAQDLGDDSNHYAPNDDYQKTHIQLLDRMLSQWRRSVYLRRIVRSIDPDIIIAHSLTPTVLVRFHGQRSNFVSVVHGALFADQVLDLNARSVKRALIKSSLKKATRVVGVSEGIVGDVAALTNGRAKAQVLLNGFAQPVSDIESESRSVVNSDSKRVVFLGRLEAQKNPLVLASIFTSEFLRRHRVQLLILGDGTLRSELLVAFGNQGVDVQERLPSGYEEGVFAPGYVNRPTRFLGAGTLLVSTSLWEGLPLNLLEAALSGSSVISTDCPHGPREIRQVLAEENEQMPCFRLVPLGQHSEFTKPTIDAFQRLIEQDATSTGTCYTAVNSSTFGPESWMVRWRSLLLELEEELQR